MAVLLDGKALSLRMRDELANKVRTLLNDGKRAPCLAVILVGDDKASQIYVRNKKTACAEAGFESLEYKLDSDTKTETLLELIDYLGRDSEVDGILVQLPLPAGIDEQAVINRIPPAKDVDCFHPVNAGKLFLSRKPEGMLLPCTPAGVIRLLDAYEIDIAGKNCVVVGRSNIVGKPAALMLLARGGTVTVLHSQTPDLAEFTRNADILVAAVGKPKLITGNMLKEGVVAIDVGMNRDESNKLCGDLDFASCEGKASYITPVPGGVGPMTIAMLLENTMISYLTK